jgi:hypothetical protein
LNALSGPALISYVEAGLQETGARGKIIPPDGILSTYLRSDVRAAVEAQVKAELEEKVVAEVKSRVKALEKAIRARQNGLRAAVEAVLSEQPTRAWDGIVSQLAREIVRKDSR